MPEKAVDIMHKYRVVLLALFLVFAGLFGLLLYLMPRQASAEPGPQPTKLPPQRTYAQQYFLTPEPTFSSYLSSPAPRAEAAATSAPASAPEGLLGNKYAWRFTDEEVITDHTYSTDDVSVSWDVYRDEKTYSNPVTFYVADVLVKDVTRLKTAFARGTYDQGGVKTMEAIAKANRCIIAISGDFARWHQNGLIVRNGEVFRKQRISSDLCVLYKNGVMETYEAGKITPDEVLAHDPWQSWHFGPELLDQYGQPKTKFNTGVAGRNPRSVIGYYEPGHYCLVIVDGRQGKYSGGLNMKELSQLMYALGCVRAYNLDGGATAHMSWQNEVVNSPSKARKVHDVICVCFPEAA